MIQLTEGILAVPVPYDAENFRLTDAVGLEFLGTVNTVTGESDFEGSLTLSIMKSKGCKGRYTIIKRL